jgi:hypothetical protein
MIVEVLEGRGQVHLRRQTNIFTPSTHILDVKKEHGCKQHPWKLSFHFFAYLV